MIDYKTLPRVARCEPSAVEVEAGKTYAWCTCGLTSNDTALCDASHRQCWTTDEATGETAKHFTPKKFTAETSELVWLCNCKQTKTPPFCDGTHKMVPQPKD